MMRAARRAHNQGAMKKATAELLGGTMKALLRSALYYKKWLDCNIIFEKIIPNEKDPNKTIKMPVHGLRPCREIGKDLYEEKESISDIIKLYNKIKCKKPTGVGVICNLSNENMIFLDFDNWQYIWKTKEEGMKWFAQEGWIVYETPRGFRAMHLLEKNAGKAGDFAIVYEGKHVGEGGGTKSIHKWTMPPSYVVGKDFYYRFLLYDWRKKQFTYTKYPWLIREFNSATSLKDLIRTLEEKLGIEISIKGSGRSQKKKKGINAQGVESLQIEEIKQLDTVKLRILLYLLFKKAGCKGLEYLMKTWLTKGYIPLIYTTWYMDNQRSTRFLFEHTILSILYWLGCESEQLERMFDEMIFKHGSETYDAGDNWNNIRYNIEAGTLNLIIRGRCPFCVLTGRGGFCSSYPLLKIKRLNKEYIRALIRKLAQ